MKRNEQIDLICTQCPLAVCDENSLFCGFRLATDPNAAQRQFVERRVQKRTSTGDRADYFASYYRENRDRKLTAAHRRHAAIREERKTI